MPKVKTVYVCQECGSKFPKWMGKCSGCGQWNTLVEEIEEKRPAAKSAGGGGRAHASPLRLASPVKISEVEQIAEQRLKSEISEFDRVLGGGFVPGSVVLLGGDPGIGKSTLSMQVAGIFSERALDVLYVSGEESLGQLKMRAQRLELAADDIWLFLETSLERVEQTIKDKDPDIVIIDSIQTLATDQLTSSPGSVAQLREVTSALTQLAKGKDIPMILIGHVTKEGAIAGPKVLEHMVDTVLYFEGEAGMSTRMLRAVKNRYGSTNEIGVFEMRGDGLEEITNPSALFLQERPEGASGSAVLPVVEGSRPLLIEMQALVSPRNYGPPRVNALGVDHNRVILMLNIIEKRTGLKVAGQDVFVNVAGGVKVAETAADLGISLAVVSSFLDVAIPMDTIILGEVGLAGEVRAIGQAPGRVKEAYALGFRRIIVPRGNLAGIEEELQLGTGDRYPGLRLDTVRTVAETIRTVFGDARPPHADSGEG
ncbi:MAG: DNA repair protein RadA [Myxococcota bacterium]